MINSVGTFASIWLGLWLALSVLFVLVYPLLRPSLLKLHPRHGSTLLLAYWVLPFAASLLSTLIVMFCNANGRCASRAGRGLSQVTVVRSSCQAAWNSLVRSV